MLGPRGLDKACMAPPTTCTASGDAARLGAGSWADHNASLQADWSTARRALTPRRRTLAVWRTRPCSAPTHGCSLGRWARWRAPNPRWSLASAVSALAAPRGRLAPLQPRPARRATFSENRLLYLRSSLERACAVLAKSLTLGSVGTPRQCRRALRGPVRAGQPRRPVALQDLATADRGRLRSRLAVLVRAGRAPGSPCRVIVVMASHAGSSCSCAAERSRPPGAGPCRSRPG